MGTFSMANRPIDGDIYIQKLSTYVRRNEEALANGLLCFSKSRNTVGKVKPLRLKFTIHHLYFVTERIESSLLGVDVGPLNVKLDTPNHEPTFISFMANNARSVKHVDSDTKSITSMNSVKSIVSNASAYWRLSLNFSKDPNIIVRDLRYLYSSFTKLPCLILTRKSNLSSINMYEEYPCDTSVPMKMFKNLQVLEMVGYEPNEIFGWHVLSDQLRILIIRDSKLSNLADCLFNLVLADEVGRMSFSGQKQPRKSAENPLPFINAQQQSILEHPHIDYEHPPPLPTLSSLWMLNKQSEHSHPYLHTPSSHQQHHQVQMNNPFARNTRRKRASTMPDKTRVGPDADMPQVDANETISPTNFLSNSGAADDFQTLADEKWSLLKQLLVSETSISVIPSYVFKPLCNIVKLNLSHNLLSEIPMGLDELQNVKYLNFSDNYIENLDNMPLSLQHLSVLNLSNNKLETIDGLDNLFRVDKIDLRHNQIDTMQALKPLLTQFRKSSSSLSGIYLSNNKLPKTYRSELFNLFNGIKVKNNVKIDDSRPGYFESALLLDNDAAAKLVARYFGEIVGEDPQTLSGSHDSHDAQDAQDAQDVQDAHESLEHIAPDLSDPPILNLSGLNIPSTNGDTFPDSSSTAAATLNPLESTLPITTASSAPTPNSTSTPRTKTETEAETETGTSPNYSIHTSMKTLASLLAALSSPDPNLMNAKPEIPRDMLHTYVLSRPQTELHSSRHLADSPTSLSEDFRQCGFTSPATSTAARISVCSHVSSESESILTLKGSLSINQLEIQQQLSANTAPNIMTPLQVTARMSS